MEISTFLQQGPTWNLRKTYLENVQQKNARIIDLLQQLQKPNILAAEEKETLFSLFNETHRLKGSGGTYGFHEISWVYNQMNAFIRSAKDDIRPLDFLEIQKTLHIMNEFSKILPRLCLFFQSTSPAQPLSSLPAILHISENRSYYEAPMEYFFLQKNTPFFTTHDPVHALEALNIAKPKWFLVNTDILETEGTGFIHTLKQHECGKNARLALLLKNKKDKEKKEIADIQADAIFEMPLDTSIDVLLQAIETWIFTP
jgi:hypothetical protein